MEDRMNYKEWLKRNPSKKFKGDDAITQLGNEVLSDISDELDPDMDYDNDIPEGDIPF